MSKIESQTVQTIQRSILEKIAKALGKAVEDSYPPAKAGVNKGNS